MDIVLDLENQTKPKSTQKYRCDLGMDPWKSTLFFWTLGSLFESWSYQRLNRVPQVPYMFCVYWIYLDISVMFLVFQIFGFVFSIIVLSFRLNFNFFLKYTSGILEKNWIFFGSPRQISGSFGYLNIFLVFVWAFGIFRVLVFFGVFGLKIYIFVS